MPKKKDTSLPPARAVALDCLSEIMKGGRDLQPVLDKYLQHSKLSSKDAALCTELVYGYLRLKERIDALLAKFLQKPEKLPQKSRLALGVAAYEMLFLDKIPVYASVDWCVGYIKKRFSLGLGKLVNAVLRNLDRLGDEAHDPQTLFVKGMSQAHHLSLWYSCPEWIVDILLNAYGEEVTRQYLKAGITPAPLGLRINRTHEEADQLCETFSALPQCAEAKGYSFLFPAGEAPKGMGGMITEGRLSRQSMASQEVLSITEPEQWEGPVWDCCCGRGGKTTALLEAQIPVELASDTAPKRLLGLRDEIERLSLEQPLILRASATEPPKNAFVPKTILADVPCSGLGTISRRPDARYHRTPEGLDKLVQTQAEILKNGWSILPQGGRFIYMTCTMNPAENEKQIEAFCKKENNVSVELEWRTPADSPYKEFFYVAVLQKK